MTIIEGRTVDERHRAIKSLFTVGGILGDSICFTVRGEPASKANSRRLAMIHGKPRFIKSGKALDYRDAFLLQCPRLDRLLDGDLIAELKIWYASRRPDLDESLILDCMQGRIYANDRQIKQKHIYWGLDRENPRTEIRILAGKDCALP